MQSLFAVFIDGAIYASWLFLVAAGLTVIYGVMRILNMAHGSFYAIGAYSAASMIGWYFADGSGNAWVSFLLLIVCALAAGLVVGTIIERGLLRYMYGRDEILMVIITYALLLILEDVMKIVWGVSPYFAYQPYTALGRVSMMGLKMSTYDLMLIGVAIVVGGALYAWLERTTLGKILRAVIHDREVASAMGVNVAKMFTITFLVGATLGTLAGALTAPAISVVPGIGVEVIVLAFAVVVVGGLGSIEGAAAGALLVGLCRAAAVHYAPEFELFVIYGVMSLVLAVRPQGLFGRTLARKI
ncbi:branched-chain amino acid ABC transporter permease [Insolitispirillum peregrinum]|uniref:Amino acid/amide ABC transporter membrane protein 1, HAAT family n=1 Tax=Insolitispirillum peregrinum TaxID=80876 RepID=A0A1N7L0S9_9PROT|nr:branched-chain amino acid ABC transporter permease [Insolitispirillum peregrinum]SIS67270.1 amino acid/amide ABC transporter membrane protein 1, HAAT family [Insolitispirillum peregrinum]